MPILKSFALALAGALVVAVVTAPTPLAQHSYPPEQIEEGRKLYDSNCGRCHNDDGAGVTGIELFKQIRRASSDDDVAKLILAGIPGTSMPPHAFSTPQALAVVAYMRSMVGVVPAAGPGAAAGGAAGGRGAKAAVGGEAARGQTIFAGKGGCTSCHRAAGAGGGSGPDLSTIGAPRGRGGFAQQPDPAALERALLEPNAEIAVAYRVFQVTPKSGAPIRGLLLNQDTFSVQLRDEAQNLRGFLKSDLASFGFLPSPMPSYQGRLTAQEVADVITFLMTLKG